MALRTFDLQKTYTANEFEALPDDGNRYELINGSIVLVGATGDEHGRISKRLVRAILFFDPEEKLGQVWFTTGFVLNKTNVPEPDIAFVVASRIPKLTKKAVPVVPDLAIEIHSPTDLRSQREREATLTKIRLYQSEGVRLIWAINPNNQTVEVYHPDTAVPLILGLNDELDGEDILPGLKVGVGQLFV